MSMAALIVLLAKMAAAGGLVVGSAVVAERAGPLLAAMILTLPISVGPVYVFLALEHDPAFMAEVARAGVAANMGNGAFCLAYVLLAQRGGVALCASGGLAAWAGTALLLRSLEMPFLLLPVLNVLVFAAIHLAVRPYLAARPPAAVARPWFVLPLRAAAVALLAGAVSTASNHVGAGWSGLLASFPVVLTSLVLIVHRSMGGPATGAIVGSGVLGLLGLGLGLASIYVTAPRLGSWVALAVALAICIAWNLALLGLARRPRRPAP